MRTSKHHIVPRSRRGSNKLENIAFVDAEKHERYHALFDNRTPEEILIYLNSYFWNNKYSIQIRGYRG